MPPAGCASPPQRTRRSADGPAATAPACRRRDWPPAASRRLQWPRLALWRTAIHSWCGTRHAAHAPRAQRERLGRNGPSAGGAHCGTPARHPSRRIWPQGSTSHRLTQARRPPNRRIDPHRLCASNGHAPRSTKTCAQSQAALTAAAAAAAAAARSSRPRCSGSAIISSFRETKGLRPLDPRAPTAVARAHPRRHGPTRRHPGRAARAAPERRDRRAAAAAAPILGNRVSRGEQPARPATRKACATPRRRTRTTDPQQPHLAAQHAHQESETPAAAALGPQHARHAPWRGPPGFTTQTGPPCLPDHHAAHARARRARTSPTSRHTSAACTL